MVPEEKASVNLDNYTFYESMSTADLLALYHAGGPYVEIHSDVIPGWVEELSSRVYARIPRRSALSSPWANSYRGDYTLHPLALAELQKLADKGE